MQIKLFDTRMMSPMRNNIFDLENNINEFLNNGHTIHNISIKPYEYRESTYYVGMVQYEECSVVKIDIDDTDVFILNKGAE